ncbi:MAG: cytochrome P450 [Ilumatobacteraceae bacterium]
MSTELDIDLSPQRFGQGIPVEDFELLRREAPIWWNEREACWVVSTHPLVERINRDPGHFSSQKGSGIGPPDGSTTARRPSILVEMDPPVHTSYRRLVIRPFTPRSIGEWEAKVREITRDAVAEFVAEGGGDFVTGVAARVPFRVIATMLGVPYEDERALFDLSNKMISNSDPDYRSAPEDGPRAIVALDDYASGLLDEHRDLRAKGCPAEDLTDHLLGCEMSGAPLDQADLENFVRTFITGGSETTRHLISNGLVALLEHPDELARFAAGEVETAPMMEEMLRYVTPVMHHSRATTEDITIEGPHGSTDIKEGDRVALWMWSANHDENVFPDPMRFVADRSPNPHTALGGGGPHYCLGAALAKLETAAIFEELRPVLGRMAIDGQVDRVWSSFVNGIKRLPVAVDPS